MFINLKKQIAHTFIFLENIFSESFVVLVPYLLLSSFSILFAAFFTLFDFGMSNESIDTMEYLPTILDQFFPLFLLLSLTFHLAKRLKVDQIIALILSIMIFFTLRTLNGSTPELIILSSEKFPFFVFTVPFLSVAVLRYLLAVNNKLVSKILMTDRVNSVFSHILPFVLTYCLVSVLLFQCSLLFGVIFELSPSLLSELPAFAYLVVRTITEHLLWIVGINGSVTFDLLFDTDLLSYLIFPDLTYIQFYEVFIIYGGSGATLSLIIAIFIGAKDRRSRKIAMIATPFAIFNINEILIYGLPIIFNRYLIIPFISVPLINILLAYVALSCYPITFTGESAPWITPAIMNAYVATDGSLFATFLQIMLIFVGTLIYIPFIRQYSAIQSPAEQAKRLAEKLEVTTALEAGEGISAYKAKASIIESNYKIQEIIKLLNSNNLKVYYQPKVNIRENKCHHYEALLRLELKDKRIVGPYFLDNIEDSGLAPIIDLWVVGQVDKDIEQWEKLDFRPQISINLHPDTLASNGTITKIKRILAGKSIDFELIERSLLNQTSAENNFNSLQASGFSLSIDDFGVGYSSLSTLVRFHFHYLKLDKTLIDTIDTREGYAICKYISAMATEVGLITVAEGVETEEQLKLIKQLNIEYVQGYYFSPAIEWRKVQHYSKTLE